MGCRLIQPDLVPFHFGDVDAETRAAIERHLVECNTCLVDYLALKRDLECADDGEAPSPASRTKLRAAVATELGLDRRWSWWARPLALTAAAASLVLATTAVNHLATSPGAPPKSADVARE